MANRSVWFSVWSVIHKLKHFRVSLYGDVTYEKEQHSINDARGYTCLYKSDAKVSKKALIMIIRSELTFLFVYCTASDDDEPLAFKKIHEFSAKDGFVEIAESLADMIQFISNEPSVGLFYIQQHTQNTVLNLNNDIEEKSHEAALHAEDSEDSITMIRSMKDYGAPVANEMIKDLRHSLAVISKKQREKGLIRQPSSTFRTGRTSSWSPASWGCGTGPEQDGEMATGYLSNAFRPKKEKANSFKVARVENLL